MTELKNCPICGGEPLQGKHWVTWCDREYVVACECGAARSGDTKSEAITAWNTRADGWQEADAARYRWLRDHSCPPHNFYIAVPDEFHGVRYSPADVDAYIDDARKVLPTPPENVT